LLLAFLVVFGLQACSRTKPARFYVLTPMPIAESVQPISTSSPAVTIGVGPIELPDYVDRPQIVTQDGANTFELAEFDRWAEPLEENFSRVLVENLSDLLAPQQITVVPWTTAMPLDYRIAVEVTRFYSDATGNTTLRAQWSIQGTKGAAMLASRQSRIRESAGSQDYAATVAAMSKTVAALSQEIATAIRSLPRTKPHI
jgi:uncharacterized lipoprotein YmbA